MNSIQALHLTPLAANHRCQPDVTPPAGSALLARGLKPVAELAAARPHGDRLRYKAGCRCSECRGANSAYESERQKARAAGDWNGTVPASSARAHLLALSAAGVGRRAVAAATDVAETVICEIRSGKKLNIRARTERRILAVTPAMASDHALVDAAATWALINELIAAGFNKTRIAQELGAESLALQIGKDRVTVRNAHRIALLHGELMASDEVLVPARPTLKRIASLRAEQYTEKQLARWLGCMDGQVRITTKRITRGFEQRVADLFERLMA